MQDLFPTPSLSDTRLRMSYEIARGEQGVLTFEPYKSFLLPHWRFRAVAIAEVSSQTLKGAFDFYVEKGDLVGADMARKFIQMGMTRAKRCVVVFHFCLLFCVFLFVFFFCLDGWSSFCRLVLGVIYQSIDVISWCCR